jgi:hypothetical protein
MRSILFACSVLLVSSNALAQDPKSQTTDPATAKEAAPETAPARAEPAQNAPEDPLLVPQAVQAAIGSDDEGRMPGAVGDVKRSYFPLYEESRGDYRLRLIPPLYLDHSRQTGTPEEDRQSLYGMLYYRRRSPKVDADVVFPIAWRVRDHDATTTVVGPFVHREAEGEHDNWLAPLYFEGARKDGGYFHAPLLLTTSHWSSKGAFTLAGPYFRDRTGSDVDWGVAPFYFHGDNGSTDGGHKTYTAIPPLLYYHREREIEGTSLTVVGPVISESTPKRSVFDVAPFFFHIEGKPETGGEEESHTTVFPLFHYGKSKAQTLFVLPGYLRRLTPDADTMITPLYSRAIARRGSTEFTAAGPILPLFMNYADKDIHHRWTAIAPLFFNSESPQASTIVTPLFGHSNRFGVSRTTWVFPSLVVSQDTQGWEVDLHPIAYFGRAGASTHNVLAPIFWDFKSETSRATVAFPLFWRFANYETGSLTQLAGNTLYLSKRVRGGTDWSFHVLPLFSYGENPNGYFWNVALGLAGYTRAAERATVRAFWIPIDVAGGAQTPAAQAANR